MVGVEAQASLAHTLQSAWPALPAQGPVRVRLRRVLLGPRPSLPDLRRRLPALVRLLRRYYAAVRVPAALHEGLAAHRVLPPARRVFPTGGHGVSRFSRPEFLRMPGVSDSAGPGSDSRGRPSPCCLPLALTASAPKIRLISELNTLPTDTPVQRFKCGTPLPAGSAGALARRPARQDADRLWSAHQCPRLPGGGGGVRGRPPPPRSPNCGSVFGCSASFWWAIAA